MSPDAKNSVAANQQLLQLSTSIYCVLAAMEFLSLSDKDQILPTRNAEKLMEETASQIYRMVFGRFKTPAEILGKENHVKQITWSEHNYQPQLGKKNGNL